jgi:tetratricopeptide (TPR) repeat protein
MALSTFQHLDENYRMYGNVPLPLVKYYLALAHLLHHEKQKAIANLNEALALDREYSPAVLLKANLDYRAGSAGSLTEAITLLSDLIEKQTNNAQAQLLLAETFLAQQRSDRALDVYQHMEQLFPKNPEVPFLMALVYVQRGEDKKARTALEKSAGIGARLPAQPCKTSPTSIFMKSVLTRHTNAWPDVMADNPKAAEPLLLQGKIYYYEGQTNQAEAAYSKAIELNPAIARCLS